MVREDLDVVYDYVHNLTSILTWVVLKYDLSSVEEICDFVVHGSEEVLRACVYTSRLPNASVGEFDDDRTIFIYADANGYGAVIPEVLNGITEQMRMGFAVQSICVLSER